MISYTIYKVGYTVAVHGLQVYHTVVTHRENWDCGCLCCRPRLDVVVKLSGKIVIGVATETVHHIVTILQVMDMKQLANGWTNARTQAHVLHLPLAMNVLTSPQLNICY